MNNKGAKWLRDGEHGRKILIRLDEAEAADLADLMERYGIKTFSSAIVFMLKVNRFVSALCKLTDGGGHDDLQGKGWFVSSKLINGRDPDNG